MTGYIFEDEDLGTIQDLIRNVGEALLEIEGDAIHHDEDLEELLPTLVTALLQYKNPPRAMFQFFDIVTRYVEDPDIAEAIREMQR